MRTYDLCADGKSAANFYTTLTRLTDNIIEETPSFLNYIITEFMNYTRTFNQDELRSKDEHFIELLQLGHFYKTYTVRADRLSFLNYIILMFLSSLRLKTPSFKRKIDYFRGKIISNLCDCKEKSVFGKTTYTLNQLKKVVRLLKSSGDFNEQGKRLVIWLHFLQDLSSRDAERILIHIENYYSTTIRIVNKKLSLYCQNSSTFIKLNRKQYQDGENVLFALQPKEAYYLNMLCAEILNRSYKQKFLQTSSKIVLLPGCMKADNNNCKSIKTDKEESCSSCTKGCSINMIQEEMRVCNTQVRIIPHSSDFSKFLITYQNYSETGLIGVACVLNLLKGGYEMRKLNIASQCVFLNYAGCSKHWLSGETTKLCIKQLTAIVTGDQQNYKTQVI